MANGLLSDTDQLAQAMGGDWAKGLSTSDKLATLGALLKSVSRGSQTSPQEVLQRAQQSQLAQVQARMQLRQSGQKALSDAQKRADRVTYLNSIADPARRQALSILSDEKLDDLIAEQYKTAATKVSSLGQQLIDAGLTPGSPEFQAAVRQSLSQPKLVTTSAGTMELPGITFGGAPKPSRVSYGGKNYIIVDGDPYEVVE